MNVLSELSTLTFVDMFMVIIGLYMIYCTMKMRKNAKVPTILLAQEEMMKLKDSKRFVEIMWKPMMIFSVVMTLLGGLGVISDEIYAIPFYSYVELVIFFLLFFYFMKAYTQARNECIY